MKWPRSFLFLWSGQTMANLADSFYIQGIVLFIYHATHSAAYAAFVPVIRLGAMMASGLIAPLLMERMPLLRLLKLSQLGQTCFLALMILIIPHVGSSFLAICVFIALTSFFDGWSNPSRNALTPRLVSEEQWVKANSLTATTDQLVLLIGWGLGGLLVTLFSPISILWLTVSLFAFSAFTLFGISDPMQNADSAATEPQANRWETLQEGWRHLFTHPLLKRLIAMDIFDFAAGGVWAGAVMLAFVTQVLQAGEEWWNFLNGTYFAGTMLGGFIALKWSKWVDHHLLLCLFIGGLSMFGFTFIYAISPWPLVSLMLCLLMGPPNQTKEIAKRTLYQSSVSLEMMPKVFAAQNMVSYALFSLSVLVMGWIVDVLSAQAAYLVATGLYAVSFVISVSLRRHAINPEHKTGARVG
ncbi:MFS transporter [Laceyella putida]|uniref:MFS transporter n=1 Tax=Laceyella putida TaxID=110101 RepID=A0ABW2RI45_9BACL